MPKIFFRLLSIATVAVLGSGCSQQSIITEGAAPAVRVDDPIAPYARPQMNMVVILDPELQAVDGPGKIAVESTGSRRTLSGTLEVWALIRNRTNYPLQIEGRTNFFDAQQAPSDMSTAWKRIYLPPLSVTTYKAQSLQVYDISYYMVELREGR